MEVSRLYYKRFFPFVHDYDETPTDYRDFDSKDEVYVHPEDKWLYDTSPTLVLIKFGTQNNAYRISATSAMRMFANCVFNEHGMLTHLSPSLIRANGVCHALYKSPKDVKYSTMVSAHRIYKITKDPGPLKACKSRLLNKNKKSFKKVLRTQWSCTSLHHKLNMPDVIEIRKSGLFSNDICTLCIKKQFFSAPGNWYQKELFPAYLNNDFIKCMISPLEIKPLKLVLMGAIFTETMGLRLDHSKSITDQYISIARHVPTYPEAFFLTTIDVCDAKISRLWSLVMGYKTNVVIDRIITFGLRKQYMILLQSVKNQLCTYGFASTNTDRPLAIGKYLFENIKPCSKTQINSMTTVLSSDEPNCPFNFYKEVDGTVWIFSEDYLISLYYLAMSSTRFTLKLITPKNKTGQNRKIENSIHPNQLEIICLNSMTNIKIYPAEYLTWSGIRRLISHQNIKLIQLYGNYSTARYGIQTEIPGYSIGAPFADLLDIFHMNLDYKQSLTFKALAHVTKLPLDLSHTAITTSSETNDLELVESMCWNTGAINVKDSHWNEIKTKTIPYLTTGNLPTKYNLNAHVQQSNKNFPQTLKRTLYSLQSLKKYTDLTTI